eukprot:GILK01010915.1.p1 GENE.GILK01010915.1~~GILK01010915.1.p1  ORF type:complete len:489 (-),score=42.16 GILK01010915.1:22-1449(-)
MDVRVLSSVQVIMGVGIFCITWLLIAKKKVSLLPLGRTGGALLGGVLMMVCGIVAPNEAYASINYDTIALLFAMMILTEYLTKDGFFELTSRLLLLNCKSGVQLLLRLAGLTALLAALFTNDTVCVFLTSTVVSTCAKSKLPFAPFLMALATCANIGSAATMIGNPQNIIIGVMSKMAFIDFLGHSILAALGGLTLNLLILYFYYKDQLRLPLSSADPPFETVRHTSLYSAVPATETEEAYLHPEDSTAAEPVAVLSPSSDLAPPATAATATQSSVRRKLYRCGLYFSVSCTFVAILCGLNMGWSTVSGAMAVIVLDACLNGKAADEVFSKVDWNLLIFFCGLFIVMHGFDTVGLTRSLWTACVPYMNLSTFFGVFNFTVIVTVGCNLMSNVPFVLLVGPQLHLLGQPKLAWLLLAFVSTVAGNLTLVGSVANLIVAEKASHAYVLTFSEYLKFGVPSTLAVISFGTFWIWLLSI